MLGAGVVTMVSHPQLEEHPMKNAEAVVGYEDRVRTASEVVDWWRNRSTMSQFIDSAESLY
jgi:hypothetical protein